MLTWTDERLAELPVKDDVRLRGLDMTRLETFCDAAFAFAVTLMIIAGGDLPDSFGALVEALKDVPAFLASFAAISVIWIAHRRWSRRYGLEDGWTTLISLAMVFVMLVYIYPLRMVASAFMSYLSGGFLPTSFSHSGRSDLTGLFVVYGLGFAVQTVMLALLYVRALRAAEQLRLDDLEIFRTKCEVTANLVLAATGLTSAVFAAVLPTSLGIWAGFAYMSLPIIMPILAKRETQGADRRRVTVNRSAEASHR